MSSIMIYGPPGSGKTTMAATMTKLGYHVHYIDVDRKIKTMKNLQPLLESKQISYEEIEAPIDSGSLLSRARSGIQYKPAKTPQGYLEICERIDGHVNDPMEDASRTVLVLDALSRVNEHMKSFIKHHSKDGIIAQPGWGAILGNYESLFDTFYSLQPNTYAHCIIIAHAKDDKDPILELIESRPLIDGSFRDKAGSFVEEQYFTFVDLPNKNAEPRFRCYTKPTGRIQQARSSRDLPVIIDSDFSVIFEGEEAPSGKTKKGRK